MAHRSVTLCGESLNGPKHICAFFDSRETQFDALMPYFLEGLEQGEEVIAIFDNDAQAELRSGMAERGLDIDCEREHGEFKLFTSDETYLKDGTFAARRMYDMLEDLLATAASGPHGAVRTCGDMEWALRNLPGTDELMEYEARVNLLTPKYDCTLLCAYDINRFSGRAIADVLASHSHVLLNGRVHVNQHYVEPLEYLKQLLRRSSRPLAREPHQSDRVH